MTDDAAILVVDDLPRTCGCSTRCSPHAASECTRPPPAGGPASCVPITARPDPAGRPDAGDRRLRDLPPDPRRDPATAFLPVVMVTASGDEEKLRASTPAPTTSSPSRSSRPSCSRGSAPWFGSSATTTPSSARPPSWPTGTASSSRGRRAGERARAGRPAAALPLTADRRADRRERGRLLPGQPPSEITVVFCDLRGFTAFAETRAGGGDGGLGEYHRALGDLIFRFEGTLEHFAGDGLMVFFNDPVPCEDPPGGRCGWRSRCANGWRSWPRGGAAGARTGLRGRDRAGLRHPRPGRFRGPLRLRGDRHRDQPGRPAVRGGAAPARSWSPSASPPGQRRWRHEVARPLELRGLLQTGRGRRRPRHRRGAVAP